MTLQKALRAKNSGVFMDSIQVEVLRNGFTAEVKSALSSPPRMKWGPYTEMQKLGCLAWSDGALTSELGEHAKRCIETEELNTALIGALFMFGVGATEAAIECSERAFESAEASGDYEFHAGLLVSTLVKGGCDWSGAPDGVYHVRVDKTYRSEEHTSELQSH